MVSTAMDDVVTDVSKRNPELEGQLAAFAHQQGTASLVNYHSIEHYEHIGHSLDSLIKESDLYPGDADKAKAAGLAILAGLTHDIRQIFHGGRVSYLGGVDENSPPPPAVPEPNQPDLAINQILKKVYTQEYAFEHQNGELTRLMSDEEVSRRIADAVCEGMGVEGKDRLRVGLYIEATKHFFGQNSGTSLMAFMDRELEAINKTLPDGEKLSLTPKERAQYLREARAVLEQDIGNFIDKEKQNEYGEKSPFTNQDFYLGTTKNTHENAALFASFEDPPRILAVAEGGNWKAEATPMQLAVGLRPNTAFMGTVSAIGQITEHHQDRLLSDILNVGVHEPGDVIKNWMERRHFENATTIVDAASMVDFISEIGRADSDLATKLTEKVLKIFERIPGDDRPLDGYSAMEKDLLIRRQHTNTAWQEVATELNKGLEIWLNPENSLALDAMQQWQEQSREQEKTAHQRALNSKETNELVMGAAMLIASFAPEYADTPIKDIPAEEVAAKIAQGAAEIFPNKVAPGNAKMAATVLQNFDAYASTDPDIALTMKIIDAVGIDMVRERGAILVRADVTTEITPEGKYELTRDIAQSEVDSWQKRVEDARSTRGVDDHIAR